MSRVDLDQKVWGKSGKTHLIIYAISHLAISPLGGLLGIIDRSKIPKDTPKDEKSEYLLFFLAIILAIVFVSLDTIMITCIRCPKWFKNCAMGLLITSVMFMIFEVIKLIVPDEDIPSFSFTKGTKLWKHYKIGVIGAYISFFISQFIRIYLGVAMLKLCALQFPDGQNPKRNEKESDVEKSGGKSAGKSGNSKMTSTEDEE